MLKVLQQPDVCPTLTETLEFIMNGVTLPFGMVCNVISCLQHKAHELLHIKGVVGKLWMVPEGWMVTLREAIEKSVFVKWTHINMGKHKIKSLPRVRLYHQVVLAIK